MIKKLSETIQYILENYKSSTHVNTLVFSVKLYHDNYTDEQIKFVINRMLKSEKIVMNDNYISLVK